MRRVNVNLRPRSFLNETRWSAVVDGRHVTVERESLMFRVTIRLSDPRFEGFGRGPVLVSRLLPSVEDCQLAAANWIAQHNLPAAAGADAGR